MTSMEAGAWQKNGPPNDEERIEESSCQQTEPEISRWKLNNFKKIKTISHYKISIKTRLRPDFRPCHNARAKILEHDPPGSPVISSRAVRKQKEGSTTNKNGPPDVEQKVRKE